MGEMEEFVPIAKPKGRKTSVMAGVVKVEENWKPPVFEKTDEQKAMLDGAYSCLLPFVAAPASARCLWRAPIQFLRAPTPHPISCFSQHA